MSTSRYTTGTKFILQSWLILIYFFLFFFFFTQTASFSTSYNLVWTPDQIRALFELSESNVTLYSIHIIRQVVRRAYLQKKRRRVLGEG